MASVEDNRRLKAKIDFGHAASRLRGFEASRPHRQVVCLDYPIVATNVKKYKDKFSTIKQFQFTPEYEGVYAPGQAFELEVAMENRDLQAGRFAHQTTFTNTTFYKDGIQIYGEIYNREEEEEKSNERIYFERC